MAEAEGKLNRVSLFARFVIEPDSPRPVMIEQTLVGYVDGNRPTLADELNRTALELAGKYDKPVYAQIWLNGRYVTFNVNH